MFSALVSLAISPWTIAVAVFGVYIWRRIMAPYTYYADKGMAFKKPWPVFGNFGAMTLQRETIAALVQNAYNEFPGKRFVGLFDFVRPLILIRDPELIRQITIKDFEHFLDHRPFLSDAEQEPLFGKSLFMLREQKWRDMRATLSPAFTGSKMRQMFQLVVDCADRATTLMLKEAKASGSKPYVPEMKDIFTRFTNDVIATSAFGVQVNSLENRDNEFYLVGKESSNFSGMKVMLKMMLFSTFPKIAKFFNIRLFSNRVVKFYHSLVHDTIAHREREGIVRPDMINLLMEARKGDLHPTSSVAKSEDGAGFATVDEIGAEQLNGNRKQKWDDDDVTAQCFLFFLAGFDTSSTLLCFAAQELMENRDIQMRLIEELDDAKANLNGKPLTYDTLQKLNYLDMVVSETLRKWPPAVATDRQCRKPYRITDENGREFTLTEKDAVWIPAYALHRDPQYYEDPDRFDPERFSDERKGEIKPFTYMPFGLGPRNCIGSRFALMECKSILYYLLTTFTFEVADTSCVPIELVPAGFALKPKNGFNVHLKPRF